MRHIFGRVVFLRSLLFCYASTIMRWSPTVVCYTHNQIGASLTMKLICFFLLTITLWCYLSHARCDTHWRLSDSLLIPLWWPSLPYYRVWGSHCTLWCGSIISSILLWLSSSVSVVCHLNHRWESAIQYFLWQLYCRLVMGLCGYGLFQALTIARICFTDCIFFSCHSPPSGVLFAPPFLLPSPRSSFPFPYSSLLTFSHRILHRIQSVPYLHRGTTATGMLSTCALLLDALAFLPSPLSRAIRFADDSSPFLDKQWWRCIPPENEKEQVGWRREGEGCEEDTDEEDYQSCEGLTCDCLFYMSLGVQQGVWRMTEEEREWLQCYVYCIWNWRVLLRWWAYILVDSGWWFAVAGFLYEWIGCLGSGHVLSASEGRVLFLCSALVKECIIACSV